MVTKKSAAMHYPFWFGGSASCIAACFTHPLDLVKVRMQTAGTTARGTTPTMLGTFVKAARNEGFLALYSGLSASLLRQATYSTTRFGVYETLKAHFQPHGQTIPPSFGTLVLMASVSGMAGGVAGNPSDIINVRMQNDRSLPPSQRLNYKHAVDGFYRMLTTEGVSSLFRGVWPNTLRAALMTASQLATYDEFKKLILGAGLGGDGIGTHFAASLLSGLVATTVCSPVDVVKTRVMVGQGKGVGVLSVLKTTVRKEGLRWVFRGWVPSFARLGPHTILTFIFMEQHKKLWRTMHQPKEPEAVFL
ncbi:mitochondrial carrier [Terfezia boudieri ATCC MYA-4762]|uniref:Mitochondrial carrier n=1 Tax=Terfezia boudieri ATCC MYA-4762 TaxID=1051890 RepID=A0A3N4M2A1_9PEZI|nr:mitochondrial carrier [Terfezia boudieri ATCC MYA-4762]